MEQSDLKIVKTFNSEEEKIKWLEANKVELMKKDYSPLEYHAYIDNLNIIVVKKAIPKILRIDQILNYKIKNHEIYSIYSSLTNGIILSSNHEWFIQKYLAINKSKPFYKDLIFYKLPDNFKFK